MRNLKAIKEESYRYLKQRELEPDFNLEKESLSLSFFFPVYEGIKGLGVFQISKDSKNRILSIFSLTEIKTKNESEILKQVNLLSSNSFRFAIYFEGKDIIFNSDSGNETLEDMQKVVEFIDFSLESFSDFVSDEEVKSILVKILGWNFVYLLIKNCCNH